MYNKAPNTGYGTIMIYSDVVTLSLLSYVLFSSHLKYEECAFYNNGNYWIINNYNESINCIMGSNIYKHTLIFIIIKK